MTQYRYSNPETSSLVVDTSVDDPEIVSTESSEVQLYLSQGNEILPCARNNSWHQIRVKRDELLAETDWWAVSDRVMSDEKTAYREALRDLPQTYASPDDVVWPTKPA